VETPSSYLKTLPEGKILGEKMKVWYVQKAATGTEGVVTNVIKKEDAYDAEAILLGFAPGKTYEAVGMGRHGNFLQWGWSAPPALMTPAGRNLFLNSIVYIHKFDGVAPVLREVALTRTGFLRNLDYFARNPQSAARYFSQEFLSKNDAAIKAHLQYYRDNVNLLFQENGLYYIDEDLKKLGFKSNSDTANLSKLIVMLPDRTKAVTAGKLLNRYTGKAFTTAEQWRDWLEQSRGRIGFSETGGYIFYVIPKR
jgi:hypothetical protein